MPKIDKIELLKLALPMKYSFETSFGVVADKQTVLVKLYSGELVGYGEAATFNAPLFNEETVDTCMYVLEKFIAPKIIGKDFATAEEFRATYKNSIKGHNIAKAGAEFAFWNLLALEKNMSLQEMFGGESAEIKVGESIGIKKTIKDTLEEIEERLEEGFTRIKVKIKPNWDYEILKAIRTEWPKIDLMADGNSAYNLREHLDVIRSFDEFGMTMIEQPLADDDIIDHSTLQRLVETPLCLDESIKSVEDARKAIELNACRIINIKPGRVGGGVESIAIHDLCQSRGIGVWGGGMLETGIGRAFNIALASKSNYIYPADMSPFQFFYEEDIVDDSFEVTKKGTVVVRKEAGLGYKVNESKVKKYTTETRVID